MWLYKWSVKRHQNREATHSHRLSKYKWRAVITRQGEKSHINMNHSVGNALSYSIMIRGCYRLTTPVLYEAFFTNKRHSGSMGHANISPNLLMIGKFWSDSSQPVRSCLTIRRRTTHKRSRQLEQVGRMPKAKVTCFDSQQYIDWFWPRLAKRDLVAWSF